MVRDKGSAYGVITMIIVAAVTIGFTSGFWYAILAGIIMIILCLTTFKIYDDYEASKLEPSKMWRVLSMSIAITLSVVQGNRIRKLMTKSLVNGMHFPNRETR